MPCQTFSLDGLLVKNTDLTKGNSVANIFVRLVWSSKFRPSVILTYSYDFLLNDGSILSDIKPTDEIGPGQQRDYQLCLIPARYHSTETIEYLNPTLKDEARPGEFYLHIYGEGIDQLLLLPTP